MALDKVRLKDSIIAKLNTLCDGNCGEWAKIAEAVADAVVDEVKDNAVVNPTSLQDSVPAAVTGTGTIS